MVSVDPVVPAEKEVIPDAWFRRNAIPEKSFRESGQLLTTFFTTAAVFGIFFCQGILIARILGPIGRGEFGTSVFFPRDVLLYVGLLGGLEVVIRHSSNPRLNSKQLKYSAATLGLFSGLITAVVSAIVSVVVLLLVNDGAKAYLIPYCLLVCLFVPWEHLHLTVSGVDRGREKYFIYNFNRLFFAASFPCLLFVAWLSGLLPPQGPTLLGVVCTLFVCSRFVGLYPTIRGLRFKEWWQSVSHRKHRIEITKFDEQPSARKLLSQSGPYAISMLASEVFERLDVILILALATMQESGFYFVAVPAAALLTIAPNSLAVFTFNAGAEQRRVSTKTAASVVLGTIFFQAVSLLILWFLIPALITFFYGARFEPSIQYVWYLLPAFAIKGFLQVTDGFLKGAGKPMIGVWARFFSILAMLVFVFCGYGHYGLLSIPMAACIGQGLSMLIVTFFVFKHIAGIEQSWRKEFDGDDD